MSIDNGRTRAMPATAGSAGKAARRMNDLNVRRYGAGSAGRQDGPGFDAAVGPNGYHWWYVDGLSDDGRHGITVIAFIGSVFSPYYAWARRKGPADPFRHVAINVALYGASGHRWAMTERGRRELSQSPREFRVGPSALTWDGDGLTIDVEEITVPLPGRLRGRIRLRPEALCTRRLVLSEAGGHIWRPVAPVARLEVAFSHPTLSWQGSGYMDMNHGAEPLEARFKRWDWCRTVGARDCWLHYDYVDRAGRETALTLRAGHDGSLADAPAPARVPLPATLWRVPRQARSAAPVPACAVTTLEDTPFYARTQLAVTLQGQSHAAMHESLDLDRFTSPMVQAMLPFRMPRRAAR
jgi:carotenoid 1,2-hydratase